MSYFAQMVPSNWFKSIIYFWSIITNIKFPMAYFHFLGENNDKDTRNVKILSLIIDIYLSGVRQGLWNSSFERPNVCGLAATISPCRMKWKSCVVIGCSFCSVFYLKPQGCIFMLALWKCHLCFFSSVWLMHFLLPDVTLTCISHSTVSKLNKGHLNPFPSLWKVVDNNLNTPVL